METPATHLPTLTLHGEIFSLVKTRDYTPVSIYKGTNSFLRIGPADLILPELALHKNLLAYGFPVSKIITEGTYLDESYYIESSLGEKHLGEIFREECVAHGKISDATFSQFLLVIQDFAEAQLRTQKSESSYESFYLGTMTNEIIKELPHLETQILRAFAKITDHTKILPTVLTHGDCNAFNLFPNGVIDFGNSFEAPVGYDLISALMSTHLFPSDTSFERVRFYTFTPSQHEHYLSALDGLFLKQNLPPLSNFIDDFTVARAFWGTARMHSFPKIQTWRYHLLEKILSTFLADGDICALLLQD